MPAPVAVFVDPVVDELRAEAACPDATFAEGLGASPETTEAFATEPEEAPEPTPTRVAEAETSPGGSERSVGVGVSRGVREAIVSGRAHSAPHRPIDRGPRRRKPPRERLGGGRRTEFASRVRPVPEDTETPADTRPADEPGPELEWPSARDILANHRTSPGPRPAVDRRPTAIQAIPTVPHEPAQWVLPAGIALPPVTACVMGLGFLAFVLSWGWAVELVERVRHDPSAPVGRGHGAAASASRECHSAGRPVVQHNGSAPRALGTLHRVGRQRGAHRGGPGAVDDGAGAIRSPP